jgi:hypothetical protein
MPWPVHPQGKSLWYLLARSLGGSTASLDIVEKREISCPCQESNPDSLAVQSAAHHYTN